MADRFFDTSATVKHYCMKQGPPRSIPSLPRSAPGTSSPTWAWSNCNPSSRGRSAPARLPPPTLPCSGEGSWPTLPPAYGRCSQSQVEISTSPDNSLRGMV
jgi:hypothetical protein